MSTSPQQISANQNNAQLSTGPRTEAGKARSCRNAQRTGLTGRAVLIEESEVHLYAALCDRFRDQWLPVGPREVELTQELADIQWRINSVPVLEYGYFASGREEFSDLYAEYPLEIRRHLVDVHSHRVYEKNIRNLQLQEARLERKRDRVEKELCELQALRKELERIAQMKARAVAEAATSKSEPKTNGFVFSSAETAPLNFSESSLSSPSVAGRQPLTAPQRA